MASIPNNFEINVAKDTHNDGVRYVHYCRIELPDTLSTLAMKKFKEVVDLFGEGYKLTLTYNECHGENVLESTDGNIEMTI